jgi:hypothetical protein
MRVKLHKAIILVAAVALGAASMTSDAMARGGGGGGHAGGGGGGGHFGGGGGHMGGGFGGGGGGHMGGGFGGAHIGGLGGVHIGAAGAFAADHSHMDSGHHGGPDFRAGHQPHAYGRRHDGGYGYYDYGYDNSCLDYPPYYRRNQWNCYW